MLVTTIPSTEFANISAVTTTCTTKTSDGHCYDPCNLLFLPVGADCVYPGSRRDQFDPKNCPEFSKYCPKFVNWDFEITKTQIFFFKFYPEFLQKRQSFSITPIFFPEFFIFIQKKAWCKGWCW